MTAVAANRPALTREPESARENLANAIQMLAAVRHDSNDPPVHRHADAIERRLRAALEQLDAETPAIQAARAVLAGSQDDRLSLVDENRELRQQVSEARRVIADQADEMDTLRAVAKAVGVFVHEIDKASMIVADQVRPLIEQYATQGGVAPLGD